MTFERLTAAEMGELEKLAFRMANEHAAMSPTDHQRYIELRKKERGRG